MQQKWSKLRGDTYCKGDLILHLDSDVVFNRPLRTRDILWLGRPILAYQRYETLNAGRPTNLKLRWGIGTAAALGAPVEHEFSRGALRVYPRSMYARARAHLEVQHGMNVTEYLRTREGKHTSHADSNRLFSDFNYLGAFASRFAAEDFTLAPQDADERRATDAVGRGLPPPLVPTPVCQGNARLATMPEMQDLLQPTLKALRNVWEGGLGCEQVPNLEVIVMQRFGSG